MHYLRQLWRKFKYILKNRLGYILIIMSQLLGYNLIEGGADRNDYNSLIDFRNYKILFLKTLKIIFRIFQ